MGLLTCQTCKLMPYAWQWNFHTEFHRGMELAPKKNAAVRGKGVGMPIPDIYADELDRVEICSGNNVRLIYVTFRGGEKIEVLSLIRPIASVKMLGNDRFERLFNLAKAGQLSASELH